MCLTSLTSYKYMFETGLIRLQVTDLSFKSYTGYQ